MIRFGLIKFFFTILSIASLFGIVNGSVVVIQGWGLIIFSSLWIFTILLYTRVGQAWHKNWDQWNERYKEKYHKFPVKQNSVDKDEQKNDPSVSNKSANIFFEVLGQTISKNSLESKIYVKPHRRKDGSQVKGHYRSKKRK